MPTLAGFSHVSLSVRDRECSAEWYGTVFGFQILERLSEERFDEIITVHPTGMVLCLQQHHQNAGEPADPVRTGADHIAFRVADRAELDRWAERLTELGVRQSPVVDRDYGAVLCLRDPDDFQLELFFRDNHP